MSNQIDAYIEKFPADVQSILNEIRAIIREIAPDADEVISYGMPTYKQKGVLVHFAAYERHIGFYPTPSGIEAFRDRLAPFKPSKGAIKFPLDKAVPYDLIAEIVRFRLEENLEK